MVEAYLSLAKTHTKLTGHTSDVPLPIITDPELIKQWQARKREELTRLGQPPSWADIGILLDDPYVLMIRDLVRSPNGSLRGYIRLINRADLEGGQGVAILPLLGSQLLLLKQFRHATRSWHLEIPRGFGEAGVPPEEQAQDEIAEEIGGVVKKLVDLGPLHVNTGMEANETRLFLATMLSIGKPNTDEGIKEVVRVSLDQVENLIRDGSITDSFSIVAYTRARLKALI